MQNSKHEKIDSKNKTTTVSLNEIQSDTHITHPIQDSTPQHHDPQNEKTTENSKNSEPGHQKLFWKSQSQSQSQFHTLVHKIWYLVTYTPRRCRWDPENPIKFSWGLTFLFAFATTFTVANLYYNTPLLSLLSVSFNKSYSTITQIPTVMQAGYAVGLVFLCPLGDLVRRRPFTLLLMGITTLIWLGLCITTHFETFVALSFVGAVTTVTPQIMLPLIGDIAPPSHRATAISLVSSGLLLGLLLARVLAGIVSQYTSWRNIYWLALGLQVFILGACWGFMPDYPATMTMTPAASNTAGVKTGVPKSSVSGPATTSSAGGAVKSNGSSSNTSSGDSENANSFTSRILLYPSILWSTITHFTQNPTLVQACLMGFFFSAPYTSFWTTLTFLLSSSPYNYSTLVIGLFAVVGILPMTLGPIYSRLILDHSVPHLSTLLGILFCMLGAAIGVLGKWNIAGPIVQCVLLDLGQQVALTACRVSVYESAPGMRSRANTAFVLFLFGGNIMGTSVGPMVFVRLGWVGMEVVAVCLLGWLLRLGG